MVKLNNPLMGTETLLQHDNCCHQMLKYVKLNNPLMGTETYVFSMYHLSFTNNGVKLNNPLMGTETPRCKIIIKSLQYIC